MLLAVLIGACTSGPPRAHARFLYTHHAALFVDEQGRGGYVIEFHTIRSVPALSEVEVRFDRPGAAPWKDTVTVGAGQRRFRFTTPLFPGFDPDRDYYVRARVMGLDRVTQLDRLLQRIRPTPTGVHAPGDTGGPGTPGAPEG